MSHLKTSPGFSFQSTISKGLFSFNSSEGLSEGTLNSNLYLDFVKELYCPKKRDAFLLTYDEVRLVVDGHAV